MGVLEFKGVFEGERRMEWELWMNLRGRNYGEKEGGILELGQDGEGGG